MRHRERRDEQMGKVESKGYIFICRLKAHFPERNRMFGGGGQTWMGELTGLPKDRIDSWSPQAREYCKLPETYKIIKQLKDNEKQPENVCY